MTKKIKFLTIFIIIISLNLAFADNKNQYLPEKVMNSDSFNLFELIDIALKNNPKTKISYNNILMNQTELKNSIISLFPNVGANYIRYFEDKMQKATVNAEYNFNQLAINAIEYKKLKNKKLITEFENSIIVKNIMMDVINTYFQLLSLKEEENALKDLLEYSNKVKEIARFKYDVGLITLNEKLNAEINDSDTNLKLLTTRKSIKELTGILNNILNINPEEKLEINYDGVKFTNELKGYQFYIGSAKSHREELKTLYRKKEIERLNNTVLKISMLPTVDIRAAYVAYDKHVYRYRYNDNNFETVLSIQFSLNNFLQTIGLIKNNRRSINSIDLEIELKEKEINLEIWKIYQNCLLDVNSFKNIKDRLTFSKENLELQLGMYKESKSSMVELLDAYSKYSTAKSSFIRTKFDIVIHKIQLLNSIGLLDLTNIKNIINIDGTKYENIQK